MDCGVAFNLHEGQKPKVVAAADLKYTSAGNNIGMLKTNKNPIYKNLELRL